MARKKNDHLKMRGWVEYALSDARTGRVIKRGRHHNVVTFGGRGWALARLGAGSNANTLVAMALGSATAAAATSQTALQSYGTIRTFNAGTTLSTSTSAAASWSGAVSFASNETWGGNPATIGEFALYNAAVSSDGVMFNRIASTATFGFATTNTLAVTITITN